MTEPFGLVVASRCAPAPTPGSMSWSLRPCANPGPRAGHAGLRRAPGRRQPLQRIFYELYRDRAAFDEHESEPHTRRFLAAVKSSSTRFQWTSCRSWLPRVCRRTAGVNPTEALAFPDRVAELRRQRGLSQRSWHRHPALGELGVQVERGVQPVERFAVLQALADALGVPARVLRPDAGPLIEAEPAEVKGDRTRRTAPGPRRAPRAQHHPLRPCQRTSRRRRSTPPAGVPSVATHPPIGIRRPRPRAGRPVARTGDRRPHHQWTEPTSDP